MRPDRWATTSWRQTTIHEVAEAWPTKRATHGGGQAVTYRVRLATGATVELDPDVVCERLSNEHGERIVLTIDRAAHVLVAHMRGKRGGFFQPGMTLTRVLGLFCSHWHQPLGSGERAHKIRVRCDRVIGTSAVVSARELAELGVLSETDLRGLAQLKEEVFAANVSGSARDRAALVARANKRWRGRNVRLTERNGVVLPAFIAPPPPTRSFVIVLDCTRGSAPAPEHNQWRIRTIYPGKLLRDPLAHAGHLPLHRDAFDVWYEHGPLLPAALRPRQPAPHGRTTSAETGPARP
jgi:hypothetical protein